MRKKKRWAKDPIILTRDLPLFRLRALPVLEVEDGSLPTSSDSVFRSDENPRAVRRKPPEHQPFKRDPPQLLFESAVKEAEMAYGRLFNGFGGNPEMRPPAVDKIGKQALYRRNGAKFIICHAYGQGGCLEGGKPF